MLQPPITAQPIVALDRLLFRYPFRIAHGVRTGTDVVLVKIKAENQEGLGEATLPPYLPWSANQVALMLQNTTIQMWWVDQSIRWSCDSANLMACPPAQAAIDMAVWQWAASIKGQTLEALVGLGSVQVPHTFTLGISDLSEMREKFQFATEQGFRFFKLKMDGVHDRSMLEQFRSLTDAPFAIDANQGWQPGDASNQWAITLQDEGCLLIEQPFHHDLHEAHLALKNQLAIPVIADEGIQNEAEWIQFGHCYSGINIKLQKCGGITPGLALLDKCRASNQYVLVGCMSESSIGCGAAEAVARGAQMADLDGPWLISNDLEIIAKAKAL